MLPLMLQELSPLPAKVVYFSPAGERLLQSRLHNLAQTQNDLILVRGRYEGVDERVIELAVDIELSIGDYVLSGGEIPALALIDGPQGCCQGFRRRDVHKK